MLTVGNAWKYRRIRPFARLAGAQNGMGKSLEVGASSRYVQHMGKAPVIKPCRTAKSHLFVGKCDLVFQCKPDNLLCTRFLYNTEYGVRFN